MFLYLVISYSPSRLESLRLQLSKLCDASRKDSRLRRYWLASFNSHPDSTHFRVLAGIRESLVYSKALAGYRIALGLAEIHIARVFYNVYLVIKEFNLGQADISIRVINEKHYDELIS